MSIYKKIIIFNAIIFVLSIIAVVWIIFKFNTFLNTPYSNNHTREYVEVEKGQHIYDIVKNLKKQNIIKRSDWFYYYVRLTGSSKKIKSGVHLFFLDYTPKDVLKELTRGGINSVKVRILEGSSLTKTVDILSKSGFNKEKLLALSSDKKFVYNLTGLKIKNLEGFMYPDTYDFDKNESAKGIIVIMYKRFKSVFKKITDRDNLTDKDYDKIIIASIVEKETALNQEKPIIASVIYNRLKIKMPLQMDSSVIYGIKNFDGNLTRKELRNKNNPYNTYAFYGLPKTPICSPSKSSLYAAYNPAKTNFLYFVSKNGKEHIFSKTLKEHNKWVNLYQKKKH